MYTEALTNCDDFSFLVIGEEEAKYYEKYYERKITRKITRKIVKDDRCLKICELKIENRQGAEELVKILAFAGYQVSVKEVKRSSSTFSGTDIYVIVEGLE